MLKLSGVSKSFVQRGKVLDNLDFSVEKSETVAITGPSGSGKTTLLNLIGLLDRPDSGNILFMNESIHSFSRDKAAEYRNRHIGFVFQDHLLLPHLTVLENILLPLFANNDAKTELEESEKYAELLMKEMGIYELSNKYPFMISGGEAQRAALVRALIKHPAILLADEPTGSLDSANAKSMGNLLMKINKDLGVTLILATHSADLARRMSKMFSLKEGKLALV